VSVSPCITCGLSFFFFQPVYLRLLHMPSFFFLQGVCTFRGMFAWKLSFFFVEVAVIADVLMVQTWLWSPEAHPQPLLVAAAAGQQKPGPQQYNTVDSCVAGLFGV